MLFEKNINILDLNIAGIKCDNSSCDYKDNTITSSQYSEYVNKSCPNCSNILLTEKDYTTVNIIIRIIKFINSVANIIIPNYFLRKLQPSKNNNIRTSIILNGTNEIPKIIKRKL